MGANSHTVRRLRRYSFISRDAQALFDIFRDKSKQLQRYGFCVSVWTIRKAVGSLYNFFTLCTGDFVLCADLMPDVAAMTSLRTFGRLDPYFQERRRK